MVILLSVALGAQGVGTLPVLLLIFEVPVSARTSNLFLWVNEASLYEDDLMSQHPWQSMQQVCDVWWWSRTRSQSSVQL